MRFPPFNRVKFDEFGVGQTLKSVSKYPEVPKTPPKLYFGVRNRVGKTPLRENSVRNCNFYSVGNEWFGILAAEILEIVPKRH